MSRIAFALLTGGSLFLAAAGCARSLELQPINEFTAALENSDLEKLKAGSSVEFQAKALRRKEAVDDLKILRLPKGKLSIVDMKDVSDTEKLVAVTAGKSKRKTRYKLVREPESEKWVVDDVIVQQTREGLKVAKSVTEQMDLLLALREFQDAWREGTREEALAVTTMEFRQVLSDLPAGYLAQLTARVTQGRQSKSQPEVQMDDGVAIATRKGSDGDLVISCRLEPDGWKVSDLAVESRTAGKHIPSVAKLANVVRTTGSFLSAYARADKATLKNVSTPKFFSRSLAPADLSLVPLPAELDAGGDYEVTLRGRQADLIVRGESNVTKIGLVREQDEADPDRAVRFAVNDVTIYELGNRQEKRLSALFTAHATMHVFSEALRLRNLSMIRKTASVDFNKRVWRHVDEKLLSQMPLREVEDVRPQVLSTDFEGAVTEITVMQGKWALTYVLRDEGGQLRVDDLHLPVTGRPTSLKTSMELLIPIHQFIAGIDAGDIARLQRTSSDDLNRLVWLQTDSVPQVGFVVPGYLHAELSAIKIGEGEALVALGDGRFGAQVRLTQEYGRHVVDEVLLIAGPEPAQRERMKHRMRLELAARSLRGQGSRFAVNPDSRTDELGSATVSALAGSSELEKTAGAPIVPSVPAPIVAPLDETFATPQVGVMRPGIKPSAN